MLIFFRHPVRTLLVATVIGALITQNYVAAVIALLLFLGWVLLVDHYVNHQLAKCATTEFDD